MRTRDEVESLLRDALGHVSAGEAEATYAFEDLTATRFGENAITQNTSAASETVAVEVAVGRRRGSATTNRLDADGLAEAVRRAEAIAREAPEDPESVPLPGPQVYPAVPPAFFASTGDLAPDAIAADVGVVVAAAKARGYTASGLFEAKRDAQAVANTHGLFGYHRRTAATYSTTVHGPNGSGKAAQNHNDYGRIDVARLTETAVENAALAQDPVEIAPGDYTVIFEPLAVAGLVGPLLFSLSARDAEEGTTAFAGSVGTRLVGDKVTLALPTDDRDLPAAPFGEAGLAVRPTTWIERGVVRRLHHNRYWAREKGEMPDAALQPMRMEGEDQSVADLVRRCDRGLLVKNLWYIRFVDRRTLMLTGMTRDGVFLVEHGRIGRPVQNLRWNESPIVFLRNAVALSRPERVGGWLTFRLPAVMSEGFTFTSGTASI